MVPQNLKFGGGVADSIVNPLVLLAVLLAGLLICLLPRSKAVVPFLVTSILVPTDHVLVLGGIHFPMIRVLVAFGFLRLLVAKLKMNVDTFSGGMSRLDKAFILLSAWNLIAGLILSRNINAVVFQLGEIYSAFGAYFLLRFFIRDNEDVRRVIRTLAFIVLVIAVLMTIETVKGWNPYALLGGARAAAYSSIMMRDGQFRAFGPFGHPIIAGTFAAVLVPLFCGLFWIDKQSRGIAILGILGATVMCVASGSSTPLLAYAFGILGLCLWPIRNYLRLVRWGIVISLVSLHIVMKAPVWHLISRIDISGGSSSYHRYLLVDQFIRHFGDWWLAGTQSNASWGWDMWDTANHYVQIGENSGLLAFALFISIIVYSFKYVGRARRASTEKPHRLLLWAIGAALLSNVVAFFGISYWDQSIIGWYALLAIIVTVANSRVAQSLSQRLENTAISSPTNSWSPIALNSA